MIESRRGFDLLIALTLLIVTSPLLVIASAWVKMGSRGPVLHRTGRVGKHGEVFTLYKFRSMVVGAPKMGPGITGADDPRITPAGRWLRRAKIDELPQLINVLRGDMSIVGPRPEDPRYVEWYTPAQRRVLDVRPGITSPASVRFRDEEALLAGATDVEAAYRDLMVQKLDIELDYLEHRSLRSDVVVIIDTVRAIVSA